MAKQFFVNSLDGFFILKNGIIWDNVKKDTVKADILIHNGIIRQVGVVESMSDDICIIDIEGAFVFPGLIDIHVHLREPGYEEKETIATGCAAAAAGGFTAVCCMPNTNPVTDNQEVVQFIKDKAANQLVEVYPIGAVTRGSNGEELAEIGYMVDAGAAAISDDGYPVRDSTIMRRALEYSKKFNIPVIEHAQDLSLTAGASMNEGFYSTKLGLTGWPNIAEDIIVYRDITLAEYVQSSLHIAHISSARSVELVRQAKEKGIDVTAEVSPHHLVLTDEVVQTYDTNFKMNPPLRSKEDVDALVNGLKDKTIDAIATDHAPHDIDEKDKEFDRAAFGVTGLETAVGVYFTELMDKHGFGLDEFVDLFVVNPRKILHIDIPEIKEGAAAELSIIDPDTEWIVEKDDFFSKSDNSCFIGKKLRGRAVCTIGKGKLWWKNKLIK